MNRRDLEEAVSTSFHRLLAEKHLVTPIDIFVDIGRLAMSDVED